MKLTKNQLYGVMLFVLILFMSILFLSGCSKNKVTEEKQIPKKTSVLIYNLPANRKVINSFGKMYDWFVLTRPMKQTDSAEVYEIIELTEDNPIMMKVVETKE